MKRFFFGLLAVSLAAIAIGCTAEPTAPVANIEEPAADTTVSIPDVTPEVKLVSLSVPNMT